MKAAVVTAPGKISIEEVEDPTPGVSDVVLEVAAVGICGTDLALATAKRCPCRNGWITTCGRDQLRVARLLII